MCAREEKGRAPSVCARGERVYTECVREREKGVRRRWCAPTTGRARVCATRECVDEDESKRVRQRRCALAKRRRRVCAEEGVRRRRGKRVCADEGMCQ